MENRWGCDLPAGSDEDIGYRSQGMLPTEIRSTDNDVFGTVREGRTGRMNDAYRAAYLTGF